MLIKLLKYLLVSFFLTISPLVNAQLSSGGFPQPELLGGSTLRSSHDERVDMPALNVDSLLQDSTRSRIGGYRFAYGFRTHLTPENSGRISFLQDGTKVWRLHIRSNGARSLNLIFSQFNLSDGDRLFIYSPDRSHILGAYTSRNNHEGGVLATSPIESDEVVVELTSLPGSTSQVAVGKVNHGYRSIRKFPGMGRSNDCNVDVSCDEDVPENSRRSVALMVVDGEIMCSGSLINNTGLDGAPYFLSAAHCLEFFEGNIASTMDEASRLAETALFYFNYEAPHCLKYVQGTLEMSLSGAQVISFYRSTDQLLLRISENPPHEYNTYLSGWNITNEIEAPVYSIHHAMGEMKRFSLSKDVPFVGSFNCCSDFRFSPDHHWTVSSWERGLTESGSSGGPLFDSRGHIIGALSGGEDYEGCNTKNIAESYYCINRVWTSRNPTYALSTMLDPSRSGVKILEGVEPYGAPCDRLSNFSSGDKLLYSEEDNYVAGNNELGYTQYAEKFSEDGQILGVFFIPERGTYSTKDSIWIKIYDGKDYPENELYRQRVRISDMQYVHRSRTFGTVDVTNLMARDNYLHFTQPVTVRKSFFVVLEVPKNPNFPFAIFASEEKSDGVNTAFFRDSVGWKPFTEHPLVKKPTSLLMNPQMTLFKRTSVQTSPSEAKSISVNPNPTDGVVDIQGSEVIKSVEIFTMEGVKVKQVTCDKQQVTVDMENLAPALYVLQVHHINGSVEYVKLMKR